MSYPQGTGVSAGSGRARRRLTVNDVRGFDGHSVYVLNKAMSIFKVPTHLMLPHTSPDSGDTKPIEIPMTYIPIDLSEWAPKEELVRNGELMRMVNRGILELVSPDEAEAILNTPAGRAEQDRIEADRMQRINSLPSEATDDPQSRNMVPADMLAKGAPGQDIDQETVGVKPSVAEAMNMKVSDESHRAALIRNIVPMMNERDKQYVRSKSSDPEIRGLVG